MRTSSPPIEPSSISLASGSPSDGVYEHALVVVLLFFPETKRASLEELQHMLKIE
jgi:hypothetical protein